MQQSAYSIVPWLDSLFASCGLALKIGRLYQNKLLLLHYASSCIAPFMLCYQKGNCCKSITPVVCSLLHSRWTGHSQRCRFQKWRPHGSILGQSLLLTEQSSNLSVNGMDQLSRFLTDKVLIFLSNIFPLPTIGGILNGIPHHIGLQQFGIVPEVLLDSLGILFATGNVYHRNFFVKGQTTTSSRSRTQ